jgi:dUTP pyrophosphatase
MLVKLNAGAQMPTYGTAEAAGMDLYGNETVEIAPNQRKMIDTGVSCAIPQGHFGHILGRSGLASKQGIAILGGVVDSDYRGTIRCILLNTSRNVVNITQGDKIAQMVILETNQQTMEEFTGEWTETTRNDAGFGSTGK